MKYIQINTVCNGSTGKIMGDIARNEITKGNEVLCIHGRRKSFSDIPTVKIGGFFSFWFHVIITTAFDLHGHGSYFKTKRIVRILRKENPDIIHLHNIHGYYLNLPVLFKYLHNEFKGEIKWTLHDCWTFTGHCSHFTMANCDKWKKQCYRCPNKKKYPVSLFFDRSRKNYGEKKKWFTGLKNVTLITPSDWLSNLVKKSFLSDYNVITVNNTINTDIFKKNIDASVLKKYSIPGDKKILLGVASVWTKEKGLDDFIKLSKMIDNNYQIVIVGLNKKQKNKLTNYLNISGILRTENQVDLAKLYSAADWFINPTYEDNYPTVNLEAVACECNVITYDTGGCSEIKGNKYYVIPVGNVEEIWNIIGSEKNEKRKK